MNKIFTTIFLIVGGMILSGLAQADFQYVDEAAAKLDAETKKLQVQCLETENELESTKVKLQETLEINAKLNPEQVALDGMGVTHSKYTFYTYDKLKAVIDVLKKQKKSRSSSISQVEFASGVKVLCGENANFFAVMYETKGSMKPTRISCENI